MSPRKPSQSDHPMVHEAFGLLKAGRVDRREFIRVAALLGTSAATDHTAADDGDLSMRLHRPPFPLMRRGGSARSRPD